eukprot:2993724-Pleurochrysis_carterae.AAC.2
MSRPRSLSHFDVHISVDQYHKSDGNSVNTPSRFGQVCANLVSFPFDGCHPLSRTPCVSIGIFASAGTRSSGWFSRATRHSRRWSRQEEDAFEGGSFAVVVVVVVVVVVAVVVVGGGDDVDVVWGRNSWTARTSTRFVFSLPLPDHSLPGDVREKKAAG